MIVSNMLCSKKCISEFTVTMCLDLFRCITLHDIVYLDKIQLTKGVNLSTQEVHYDSCDRFLD